MSEEFCFITEKIQLLFMLFLSCRKKIDLLQDHLLIVLYLVFIIVRKCRYIVKFRLFKKLEC